MNDDDHTDDLDGDLNGDLDRRLSAAGGARTRPLDDLTIARIERRLRDQHGARRRPRVLAPVLAGVAAALVVVALANAGSEPQAIGTAGVGRDLDAPATTTAPERDDDRSDGEESPDGDEARDDEAPVDPTVPSGDGDAGDPDDDDDGGPSGADDRGDRVAAPPSTDARPSPPADDGSDVRPTTTTTAPSDARSTTTTSTAPPSPSRIEARVQARGKQAVIGWSEYRGDDLVRWTVVRYTEPPEGSTAPAKEEVVLRDGDPGVRQFIDDPPDRGRVAYMVRGHRRDGEVVARSDRVPLKR